MKTKLIIVLWILFSFVKLETIKPSDDIWDKVKSFLEQGLMYNESKFYFVFDEYNCTNFDLSSKEMIELQEKQEELYRSYKINNYIFAVKTLDTSIESIDKAADSLSTYIGKYYNIGMSNSIIALIVMDIQKVRIRTGSSLRSKITDSEAQKIISNMGTNMRAKNYYKAFYNIITDIKYYYVNGGSSNSSSKKNQTDTSSKKPSTLESIIIVVLLVGFCFLIYYCQKKGYCKGSGRSYYKYKKGTSKHNYGGEERNNSFEDRDNSFGGYSSGGGGGGSGGATGGW